MTSPSWPLGTAPLQVLDVADVRERCRAYRHALPDAEIVYAAKALLTPGVARPVGAEGMSIDACSGGEVAIAAKEVGTRRGLRLVGLHCHLGSQVPMTVVGRHCEATDRIAEGVSLPADLAVGDLLAVPCTGAYTRSMASTYNAVAPTPMLGVGGGAALPI